MLRASVVAIMLMTAPAIGKELSGLDATIAGVMNGPGPSAVVGETGTPHIHGAGPRSGTLGIDGEPYISWEEYTRLAASIGENPQFGPEDIGDGPDEDGRYWSVLGHVFDPHWNAPDDQGFPHDGPCIQDYCWIILEYDDEDGVAEPVVWSLEMGPVPYDYGHEPPTPPEDDGYDPSTDTSDCANDAC